MSNPLFNSLGGQKQAGPMGNMQALINQFNQFRNSFHGDAKQQVQQLLNSGRMSQEQFNRFQQMAQQIQQMLPK